MGRLSTTKCTYLPTYLLSITHTLETHRNKQRTNSRSKILTHSNIRIFVRRYCSNLSRCAEEMLQAHLSSVPASRPS